MKRLGKLPVSAPNIFGISISLETIFNLFKRFVLLKQNQLKKIRGSFTNCLFFAHGTSQGL